MDKLTVRSIAKAINESVPEATRRSGITAVFRFISTTER